MDWTFIVEDYVRARWIMQRRRISQGIIVNIATGTGVWVEEAIATFHEREISGINVHVYGWYYQSQLLQLTDRHI